MKRDMDALTVMLSALDPIEGLSMLDIGYGQLAKALTVRG